MADQRVTFVLDAKDAGVVRAWMAAKDSVAAFESSLKQVDAAQLRNSESARQFDAGVKRLMESLRSVDEKMVAKQRTLKEALDAGKISAEEYATAMERLNAQGSVTEGGLANQVNLVGTLTKGWAAATAAVAAFGEEIRKSQSLQQSEADRIDALDRQLQISANLTDAEMPAARKKLEQIAVENAVTPEQAYQTANAMASAGFGNDQVFGEGLANFLRIQSAQQLANKPSDAATVVSGTTQLLSAEGLPLTSQNVRKVGTAFQSLKETPLTYQDAPYLAKERGATKQAGVTFEEAMSGAGEMRRTYSAGEAMTGMRNVATRMATAGGFKDRTEALKMIGLTPADVDMVGESFMDAVDRVWSGVQKAPAEQRNQILAKLFDEASVAPFVSLAQGRADILRRGKTLEDPTMFNNDVAIAQSGRNAARTRLQTSETFAQAEMGQAEQDAAYKLALRQTLREGGMYDWYTNFRTEGVTLPLIGPLPIPGTYEGNRRFGMSPETAAGWSTSFGSGQSEQIRDRVNAAQEPPSPPPSPLKTIAGDPREKPELKTLEFRAGTKVEFEQGPYRAGKREELQKLAVTAADEKMQRAMEQQNVLVSEQNKLLGELVNKMSQPSRRPNLAPPPRRPSEALGDRP